MATQQGALLAVSWSLGIIAVGGNASGVEFFDLRCPRQLPSLGATTPAGAPGAAKHGRSVRCRLPYLGSQPLGAGGLGTATAVAFASDDVLVVGVAGSGSEHGVSVYRIRRVLSPMVSPTRGGAAVMAATVSCERVCTWPGVGARVTAVAVVDGESEEGPVGVAVACGTSGGWHLIDLRRANAAACPAVTVSAPTQDAVVQVARTPVPGAVLTVDAAGAVRMWKCRHSDVDVRVECVGVVCPASQRARAVAACWGAARAGAAAAKMAVVVTGHDDGSMRVWRAAPERTSSKCKPVATYPALHAGGKSLRLCASAASPRGGMIAVAAHDSPLVRFWQLAPVSTAGLDAMSPFVDGDDTRAWRGADVHLHMPTARECVSFPSWRIPPESTLLGAALCPTLPSQHAVAALLETPTGTRPTALAVCLSSTGLHLVGLHYAALPTEPPTPPPPAPDADAEAEESKGVVMPTPLPNPAADPYSPLAGGHGGATAGAATSTGDGATASAATSTGERAADGAATSIGDGAATSIGDGAADGAATSIGDVAPNGPAGAVALAGDGATATAAGMGTVAHQFLLPPRKADTSGASAWTTDEGKDSSDGGGDSRQNDEDVTPERFASRLRELSRRVSGMEGDLRAVRRSFALFTHDVQSQMDAMLQLLQKIPTPR